MNKKQLFKEPLWDFGEYSIESTNYADKKPANYNSLIDFSSYKIQHDHLMNFLSSFLDDNLLSLARYNWFTYRICNELMPHHIKSLSGWHHDRFQESVATKRPMMMFVWASQNATHLRPVNNKKEYYELDANHLYAFRNDLFQHRMPPLKRKDFNNRIFIRQFIFSKMEDALFG